MSAAPKTPVQISLAQINTCVGAIPSNMTRIFEEVNAAAKTGSSFVVFPEMALTGYPIEDLAFRSSFRQTSGTALAEIAQQLDADGLGQMVAVIGYLDYNPSTERPLNAAAIIHQGVVMHRYAKMQLPNYGVFDEYRIFAAGTQPCIATIAGLRVAVLICEDLWIDSEAIEQLAKARLDLVLVLNGSPFERQKTNLREQLATRRALEFQAPVAYVNLVGGQDDLVFDGGSFAVDASGQLIGRGARFREDHLRLTLVSRRGDNPAQLAGTVLEPELDPWAEVYQALVLGVRDYIRKNGFTSVALGLSGGIDSALVAIIAADALGGENVVGVSMPSKYSSEHSKFDAQDIANRIGADYRVLAIDHLMEAFLSHQPLSGIAEENLQARLRGMTLMALSNAEGHMVLATGNKSELATGYSTIYGDAVGGFAPLKDLLKTEVWKLARWRNELAIDAGELPPIPESSITKPPSAELRPNQRDQDSLPDYTILDAVISAYVEYGLGRADLVNAGHDPAAVDRVLSLVDGAEWKRRQYPPGPKLSSIAFGRDRRLPITNGWQEPKGAS